MVWIIAGVLVLLVLFFIVTYNSLIVLRQRVRNAWAQVDVQLKRRYDLIPNLVSTVQGYMTHERETFEQITKARSQAMNASDPAESAQAESQLTGTLRTLFAVAENYPELKADQNFRELQKELSDTESKIAYARQFYNDIVQKFNTRIHVFPTVLIAGLLGFTERSFFNLEEGSVEREAVQVSFDR